jgi:hypothetical protein
MKKGKEEEDISDGVELLDIGRFDFAWKLHERFHLPGCSC